MNFTDEQKHIIQNIHHNSYISAGPGSGKSTVLGAVCSKLLENKDQVVLLLTFTNAAAKSILCKCPVDSLRVRGCTFHSYAYRVLRDSGVTASVCDEHKKRLIIKTLFKCRKDKKKFEEIYDRICTDLSQYPSKRNAVTDAYLQELEKYCLIDFDSIINKFLEMQNLTFNFKPTHILVDELQDTSVSQFEMLNKITRKSGSTVIGVADDDQCIYEWRNADPRNISKFITQHACKQYNLGTNFRSNATIVRISTNLIVNNKNRIQKQLRSYTTKEGLIKEYQCQNAFDEIDYVVIKCLQYPASKIAILYRNRTFKYHLEYKLRKAGIKYKVNDFLDITDRSAVRAMIACLKIASNSYDYYDLEQASKALKSIGKKTVEKLKEDTKRAVQALLDAGKLKSIKNLQKSFQHCIDTPLSRLVELVENEFVASFDYQRQMKDLLIDITRSYNTTSTDIKDLADELGLDAKDDPQNDSALIELSTIHGFKGLEDDIVIIPFCQMFLEDVPGRIVDEEAERRLFYVAITRAKEKLYLSYSGPKPKFIKEMKI